MAPHLVPARLLKEAIALQAQLATEQRHWLLPAHPHGTADQRQGTASSEEEDWRSVAGSPDPGGCRHAPHGALAPTPQQHASSSSSTAGPATDTKPAVQHVLGTSRQQAGSPGQLQGLQHSSPQQPGAAARAAAAAAAAAAAQQGSTAQRPPASSAAAAEPLAASWAAALDLLPEASASLDRKYAALLAALELDAGASAAGTHPQPPATARPPQPQHLPQWVSTHQPHMPGSGSQEAAQERWMLLPAAPGSSGSGAAPDGSLLPRAAVGAGADGATAPAAASGPQETATAAASAMRSAAEVGPRHASGRGGRTHNTCTAPALGLCSVPG